MMQHDLVSRLRNPTRRDAQTIRELREHALRFGDQSLQKAAISGLEKIGGSEAVLALTQRLLDEWGMGAIERAMKGLAKLAPDGGLLALTATLVSDSRFVHQKLRLLSDAARKMDREDAAESLEVVYRQTDTICELRESIPKGLALLESNPLDDVRHGATLARILGRIPVWAGNVTPPNGTKLDRAIAYSQQRVRGLVEVLIGHRSSGI